MAAWITETRLDVIARLRAAIAAAEPDTPLDGVQLPENRWKRYTPEDMPGMFVRVSRIRRQGIGNNVPLFDLEAEIEVHAGVAALELDARQLDDRLEAIFDQVDLVLLEDPEWVARFTSVNAADVEYDDAEGSDHYIRVGMVTYTVTAQQEFTPRVPDDLRDVDATVPFAPVPGGAPTEHHQVTAHFTFEE